MDDRPGIPLSIHHTPIAVTFAFFCDGRHRVVDPNEREEKSMEGRMTITLNPHSEICAIHKSGGVSLSTDAVTSCTRVAMVKVSALSESLQTALREEEERLKARKRAREVAAYGSAADGGGDDADSDAVESPAKRRMAAAPKADAPTIMAGAEGAKVVPGGVTSIEDSEKDLAAFLDKKKKKKKRKKPADAL